MKAATTSAADYLPGRLSLRGLREAARHCRGCPLYRNATQTVFGDGPARAGLMLVGEVPGDHEDLEGRPFVGGAGRLLDEALLSAGLSRDQIYITNAVKHFKWEPDGKRRLHKKPSASEIRACRPWLNAEIEVVRPAAIVCLGATAAAVLLGPKFRLTRSRGLPQQTPFCRCVIATFHPAAVLRSPRTDDRRRMSQLLIHDIALAAQTIANA